MNQLDRLRRLAEDAAAKAAALRSASADRVVILHAPLYEVLEAIGRQHRHDMPAIAMAAACALGEFVAKFGPPNHQLLIVETLKDCLERSNAEHRSDQPRKE